MARLGLKRSVLILAGVSLPGLCACTNLESFSAGALAVPPGSPVALAVEDAQRNPGPMPRFADIPKAPKDAPSDQTRLEAETRVASAAQALERELAAFPAVETAATAAFTARNQDIFQGIETPTAADRAASEAFARAARARATPPPPPQ